MDVKTIEQAVTLGTRTGRVFFATADGSGLPHLAAAREISLEKTSQVRVATWFCPGTMANLNENPLVSLVVWDEDRDFGYQLTGKAVNTEEVAMMDGYVEGADEMTSIPQEEYRITVEVERVLHFSLKPHSDVERL